MRYFTTPGGGVAYRDDPDYVAPEDWTETNESTYSKRKASLVAVREADKAERAEAQRAQVEADYRSLRDAGISEGAASRLTGYRPKFVETEIKEA